MRTPAPDGIEAENMKGGRENPAPFLLLLAVLVLGLTGVVGGYPSRIVRAEADAATLSVESADVLRNGMFFEVVIDVTPRKAAQDLTIAFSRDLWRDITINTMIPAAEEETYSGGYRRFSFGPVDAGDTVSFKMDGQINPVLFTGGKGEIVALDGEKRLANLPFKLKVLP